VLKQNLMKNKKPKKINKKQEKDSKKKCQICQYDKRAALQVHRITPGEKGGEYTENNSVVCCSNCHNRIHHGDLKIIGWFQSTAGRVLCIIDGEGQEIFLEEV